MKTDRWVKRWQIPKSTGDGFWIVAIDKDGKYGCSCPRWKFKRENCHHIQCVQEHPGLNSNGQIESEKPTLIPAHVSKPIYDAEQNTIFYPLVPIGGPVWMEATICYFLMEHGFSWSETKGRRHIPNSCGWTRQAIYGYIEQHGLAEYAHIENIYDDSMIKQAS